MFGIFLLQYKQCTFLLIKVFSILPSTVAVSLEVWNVLLLSWKVIWSSVSLNDVDLVVVSDLMFEKSLLANFWCRRPELTVMAVSVAKVSHRVGVIIPLLSAIIISLLLSSWPHTSFVISSPVLTTFARSETSVKKVLFEDTDWNNTLLIQLPGISINLRSTVRSWMRYNYSPHPQIPKSTHCPKFDQWNKQLCKWSNLRQEQQ